MRALTRTISMLERLKMPAKQYDLVSDDGYDSRIPMHNDEAFQHGIFFQAKYIGTLDVPRPNSRVEIVAAMRRIRYEFKAKAVKKKKVSINVSVDGVKILLRRKRRNLFNEDKEDPEFDEKHLLVMNHPIYRIFYVSHDSQDLKIFSYIARDGTTNVFKCNVFKALKKSQAMRIVRTIGQAFEVCHKLSQQVAQQEEGDEDGETDTAVTTAAATVKDESGSSLNRDVDSTEHVEKAVAMETSVEAAPANTSQADNMSERGRRRSRATPSISSSAPAAGWETAESLWVQHRMRQLEQRLEHQRQGTQAALDQVNMLKEQLTAETSARLQAQARAHTLLQQNRDLLEHVDSLIKHLQEVEQGTNRTFDNESATVLDLVTPSTSGRSPLFATADMHPSPELLTNSYTEPPMSTSNPYPQSVAASQAPAAAKVGVNSHFTGGVDVNCNTPASTPQTEPQRPTLNDVANNNRPPSRGMIGFTMAETQMLDSLLKRIQQQKGGGTAPLSTFDDSVLTNGSTASLGSTDKWVIGDKVGQRSPVNGLSKQITYNSTTADSLVAADAVNMNVMAAAAATAMANMNLKMNSPTKRHSSTSAELLRQKESQRSLTHMTTKDTISSASESKLLGTGRNSRQNQQSVSASNFAALRSK